MNAKNILAGILLLAFLFNSDQTIAQKMKEKYDMYSTEQIRVVKGKEKEFESAVKAHNEKYHKEGTHQAWLRAIVTGPKAGSYVWISGPKMFSDFETRPGEGAHADDWSNNVDPYVKYYGTVEFWKRNDELSFTAPDSEGDKLSQVWYIDVDKGGWEKFNAALEKAVAVSTKIGKDSFHTYNTTFSGGDGRDVALVFPFGKWSDLDIDDSFMEEFEKLHGEGSWKTFLDDWNSSTSKIVQVVSKLVD